MKPHVDNLRELLGSVLATEATEIDCEVFLNRVGCYLESSDHDRSITPELVAVAQHLSVCPECKQEFEALVGVYISDF